MKLSQKQMNQVTACIQLFLCGIMAAVAFRREIRLGYKVNNKLKKEDLKRKEEREGQYDRFFRSHGLPPIWTAWYPKR